MWRRRSSSRSIFIPDPSSGLLAAPERFEGDSCALVKSPAAPLPPNCDSLHGIPEELDLSVSRPSQSQTRHSRLERRRLQAETIGSAARASNPPARALEYRANVLLLHVDQLRTVLH